MKKASYKAAPIPSQLSHDEYKYGTKDLIYHVPPNRKFQDSIVPIDFFMRWIQSKNEVTMVETINNKFEKTYPSNKIRIPVNKEAVLKNGIVKPENADLIVPYIDIEVDPEALQKNRLMMIDILANNNWERPIYFTGGASADEEYIWLKDYLQLDGSAYKLVPIRTPLNGSSLFDMGRLDADTNYDYYKNIDWKNINDGKIYLDSETRKNAVSFRNNIVRTVEALINEDEKDKAEELLDMSIEKMPIDGFLHYGMLLGYPDAYYELGRPEKARKITAELIDKFNQNLEYYTQFDDHLFDYGYDKIENNLLMFDQLVKTAIQYDTPEYSEDLFDQFFNNMPFQEYFYNRFLTNYPEYFYLLKKPAKAREIVEQLTTEFEAKLDKFSKLNEAQLQANFDELEAYLLMYDRLVKQTMKFDDEVYSNEIKEKYIRKLETFSKLIE